jgi:hypothetical protein
VLTRRGKMQVRAYREGGERAEKQGFASYQLSAVGYQKSATSFQTVTIEIKNHFE